ncbi:MAG: hypothetical protein CVT68_09790, partial [Actinobacteria bacterium HGW-Actinobacteria-8]
PAKGRDTMGVIFAKPGKGDHIIGIARNVERHLDVDEVVDPDATAEGGEAAADVVVADTDPTPTTEAPTPEDA